MPSAAALRAQIEHNLEARFPAALSPARPAVRDVWPAGIGAVDALLDGGLPGGAISEVTGTASSGRTSLALVFVAERTAAGRVCAWVDAHDALDPASAAASGVVLPRLLWIRCGEEARGRQGKEGKSGDGRQRTWTRLDQALRATDLLLQGGGFAAVVLDLGSTAPEYARRIPAATWFRFRQAAERTRTSLVVLGQTSCAQSSAAVVLECVRLRAETAGGTVLTGFSGQAVRGQERFAPVEIGSRKPPASPWLIDAQWQRGKRA